MSDDRRDDMLLDKLSSMDHKIDEIREVQKAYGAHLSSLDISVAKTEKDLAYHIKMYNDIREDFSKHEDENKEHFEKIEADVIPIKQQVHTSEKVFKWILGGGGLLGTVWMVLKVLELLKNAG
jgi:chromosome segregation ATPase